jgi:hypothetical protein
MDSARTEVCRSYPLTQRLLERPLLLRCLVRAVHSYAGFSLSRALQIGLPAHVASIGEVSEYASKVSIFKHSFMWIRSVTCAECMSVRYAAHVMCQTSHNHQTLLPVCCEMQEFSLERTLDKMQADWAGETIALLFGA